MNTSIYLFGNLNSGYTQYPDDHTASIFKNFSANAKAAAQIAMHRYGDLMYYGYIRKLEGNQYIGLCIVLNGLAISRIDNLFSLFETTIEELIYRGVLVHFDERGNIVTNIDKLEDHIEEVEQAIDALRAGISNFEPHCMPLPPVNYSTRENAIYDFNIDDDQDEIIKSSYTNGYTYIYKLEDYNTHRLDSYKEILAKSHKEREELQRQIKSYQEKEERQRQAKSYQEQEALRRQGERRGNQVQAKKETKSSSGCGCWSVLGWLFIIFYAFIIFIFLLIKCST